jgi:hypothetical protein
MMMVAIETEPTFRAGLPKELFRGNYYAYRGRNWNISPDGKRFLMLKVPETTEDESTKESIAERSRKINIM